MTTSISPESPIFQAAVPVQPVAVHPVFEPIRALNFYNSDDSHLLVIILQNLSISRQDGLLLHNGHPRCLVLVGSQGPKNKKNFKFEI